jgi:hypothetical protein
MIVWYRVSLASPCCPRHLFNTPSRFVPFYEVAAPQGTSTVTYEREPEDWETWETWW